MPSCIHCGAPCPTGAASSCPRCGTPRTPGTSGTWGANATGGTAHQPNRSPAPGYIRVGSTMLPRWLPWLLLALFLVGGGAEFLILRSDSDPSSPASDYPSPSTTPPAVPGLDPTPTSTPYTAPGDPSDSPSSSTPPSPSPSADTPSGTVERFYQEINAHDFAAAWELGGKNIGGANYSDWVAGYGSTSHITVSAVDRTSDSTGAGEVSAVVRALQNDGSVKVYSGTYTVSDGAIVDAHLTGSQ
ncbi:hypothetical protein ACIQU6_23075 [Streptomyces sp. NPDC090442]|uniref:hypothetical protein n=1 Tax=Streptomyces sp. NPDC090442 TaxID=3365962 RepID=UPI003800612A